MRARTVSVAQGVFYVATGLWPIVHYRSFERATGPKVDDWLVKTLGGVIAAVGVALLANRTSSRVLGVASAAVLGAADVVYAGRGRISPVYFADAAAELGIAAAWARAR